MVARDCSATGLGASRRGIENSGVRKLRRFDSQVPANGGEMGLARCGASFDSKSNRCITDMPTQPFERSTVSLIVGVRGAMERPTDLSAIWAPERL